MKLQSRCEVVEATFMNPAKNNGVEMDILTRDAEGKSGDLIEVKDGQMILYGSDNNDSDGRGDGPALSDAEVRKVRVSLAKHLVAVAKKAGLHAEFSE